MPKSFAFAAALAAALIVLLTAVVSGTATPGYSHLSQFISELGASGSLHEYPVRFAGFLPAGIVMLVFCWLARRTLPPSPWTSAAFLGLAIYALGYVVAAFLPCDPGCRPAHPSAAQAVHNAVGGLGYLVAPASLLVLALRSRSWPASRLLPIAGFVAAGVALLGLLSLSPASPYVGLSQRAIEASVLVWVVMCGWYIRSRSTAGSARSDP
ncbi:hypothetical protein BH09PSE6_BH09PSE6_09640 [soil metagenome]